MIKTNLLFNTLTGLNTTATTIAPNAQFTSATSNQYAHCDVIAVCNTITGVTATAGITLNVQELFGSQYWTTARLVNITATGAYFLTYDNNNQQAGTPYASPGTQQNAMLGKGMAKQIVTTSSNLTALSLDVYFCFWED